MASNNDGNLPMVYGGQVHQGGDKDEGGIMYNKEEIREHHQGGRHPILHLLVNQ